MTQHTLIVLQHGLWGSKNHMNFIQESIEHSCTDPKTVSILNVDVNEGKYTYDGIDVCGERLVEKITASVKELATKGISVKRIIIVGYSLGGLISRYAIGILGKIGFFDQVEPLLFATFATPHLGVRREPKSFYSKTFNFLSGRVLARTGEQLQMVDEYEDGRPIMDIMTDPDREFYQYLSQFKQRRLYANVINDRTVPYWTAAIDTTNYFESITKLKISLDDTYSSIISSFDLMSDDHDKTQHDMTSVEIARVGALVIFSPLICLVVAVALGYMSTQALVSRLRVARILASPRTLMSKSYNSIGSEGDNILVDAIDDAVNIPIGSHPAEKATTVTKGSTHIYNVKASNRLMQHTKPMDMTPTQIEMHRRLNQLEWNRVLVYIRGANAHASIVCRGKLFANTGGRATIQQFVDSLTL